MRKDPVEVGRITIILPPEGIEAIAAAVVRQLREGGFLQPVTEVKESPQAGKNGRVPVSQYEVYLTETEAATYLSGLGVKFSKGTLQKQRVSGGGVPFVKFKSRVRYRREDLDAWLAGVPVRASTSDTGIPQKGNRPK